MLLLLVWIFSKLFFSNKYIETLLFDNNSNHTKVFCIEYHSEHLVIHIICVYNNLCCI